MLNEIEIKLLEAEINESVELLHQNGYNISIMSESVEHPFPSINPCVGGNKFFEAFASDCKCCSGMRIAVLAVILAAVSIWEIINVF